MANLTSLSLSRFVCVWIFEHMGREKCGENRKDFQIHLVPWLFSIAQEISIL